MKAASVPPAQDDTKEASPVKLESHAICEELHAPAEGPDGETPPPVFRVGEQVEVRLLPPTSRDGTPAGSGTA